MATLYWVLCISGIGVAIERFLRTPDKDRRYAYPNDPARWFGATGVPAVSLKNMARSALFWAALVGAFGLVGGLLNLFAPLWLSFPLALVAGFAAAHALGRWLLQAGPGAMKAMPKRPKRPLRGKRPRVLFLGGSLNQTTQMHQIAQEMPEIDAWFCPYHSDHWFFVAGRKLYLQEFAVAGYRRRRITFDYINEHGLQMDLHGERNRYDMLVLPNDMVVPHDNRDVPIVLVQEGITDPPNLRYWWWRHTRMIHRVFCGTNTFGLSNLYTKFCVASEGYARHFASLGADPDKIIVTGTPNFDNFKRFLDNDFPHHGFVLACTTDSRESGETAPARDRMEFLRRVVRVANGRQVIFKLHPAEKVERATREIKEVAPDALVYSSGSAEEMVANCSVLFTEWSSLTFCGVALGKEVHTYHPMSVIEELLPLQNRCAAANIANVCRELLGS